MSFLRSGSQESNASNDTQIGVETKKLWSFEDNCIKLCENFATTKWAAKWNPLAKFGKVFRSCKTTSKHMCACRWFRSYETPCEISQVDCISQLISQLQNFCSALCGCLQTAITSSFELQFAHRLKCWTPNFPSFEMKYSIHQMESRKCSKSVQHFLSSWISSC